MFSTPNKQKTSFNLDATAESKFSEIINEQLKSFLNVNKSQLLPPEGKGCNCRKSRCLKLYCICISKGQLCGDQCHCRDCYNCEQKANTAERIQAIEAIHSKDKQAFSRRINLKKKGNFKGCNCRKSGCLKNYCECFSNSLKCSQSCNCDSCKNAGQDYFRRKRRHAVPQQLKKQIYFP